MSMGEQWRLHCTSQCGQWMPLSEHVYCVAITFKMTEWVEQRICIRFCIKLEHSSAETIWMIQKAFRDDAMSAAQIRMWHNLFKHGWESVESDPRFRRPATRRTPHSIEHGQATINRDRRLSVWELEADSRILKTTVSKILTQDLDMKDVLAKFIPQLLLPEQKEHYAAVERTVWGPNVPTLKGTEIIVLHAMFLLQ